MKLKYLLFYCFYLSSLYQNINNNFFRLKKINNKLIIDILIIQKYYKIS